MVSNKYATDDSGKVQREKENYAINNNMNRIAINVKYNVHYFMFYHSFTLLNCHYFTLFSFMKILLPANNDNENKTEERKIEIVFITCVCITYVCGRVFSFDFFFFIVFIEFINFWYCFITSLPSYFIHTTSFNWVLIGTTKQQQYIN